MLTNMKHLFKILRIFLCTLGKVKDLSENAILVTMDVKALFTNIQHEEGIKCLQEELEESTFKMS